MYESEGGEEVEPPKPTFNSYIQGYPDNSFRPDNNITRAEVATILARLSKGFVDGEIYDGSASDLDVSVWYATYMTYAIENGIISGYEDGTVRPTDNITRGEFAAMLIRFLDKVAEGTTDFEDAMGHWSEAYLAVLVNDGVLNGYEDDTIRPDRNLSRAEAVKMINKAIELVADDAEISRFPSDVTDTHWAYSEILAALNTDISTLIR